MVNLKIKAFIVNIKILILPPCRIIGQICILRQTLVINFSQKKSEIFEIKIISLESSFKYESNGIIFI
jgi:hypothetical protein